MTREQIYKEQLQALGIYDPAFDPEIKTLAQLERRLTRLQKEWSATAPPGGKPRSGPCFPPIYSLRSATARR